MIAAVVMFGLFALGERLPSEYAALLVLHVFAWVCFVGAVSLLSSRQHKMMRAPERV